MIVSSQLFEAYLECSTKCWLRSRVEPTTGNFYAEWARPQNETYLEYGLKRAFATVPESDRATAPPIPKNPKDVTWCLAIDVRWRTRDLESRLQAVERIPSEGHGRPAQFIPYRFEFANKLAKEHKLLLAFDALLLSEALGREVTLGKIVHGDSHATLKVKTPAFTGEVRKRIKEIAALLAGNSPPDLVLNRHCGQCEFKTRCNTQAREKDELSLLSGISEKDRKRLHSKGIFTVTQLSYTFRPRRRRRESRGKQEKHHHSLRALAIRENKIHAVGIPDPKPPDPFEAFARRSVRRGPGATRRTWRSPWRDSSQDAGNSMCGAGNLQTGAPSGPLASGRTHESSLSRAASSRSAYHPIAPG